MTGANKMLTRFKKLAKSAFLAAVGLLVVLHIKNCGEKRPAREPSPRPVTVALATAKDVPIYLESFGTLASLDDIDIKAQVTGKIRAVHFQEGDRVSEGSLLFTIEPDEFKANFDKAQAALNRDQADLEFKKDTLERNKQLVRDDFISKQEFEKYKTDAEVAEAQVHLSKASLALEEILLSYCYIHSPVSGLTGKRQVDPGNIVTANNGPTLVNIKTTDTLYIDFTIPEKSLNKVRRAREKEELKVEISLEGEDQTYSGSLDFIDNTVDETTGTVSLRAKVANKDNALWAGQFVKVQLILTIKEQAVVVPFAAVRLGQKGYYLFAITDDNKADLRYVDTGEKYLDDIIITKGVKPGEKIVTSGQLGLSPGASIIDTAQSGNENKSADSGAGSQKNQNNPSLKKRQ